MNDNQIITIIGNYKVFLSNVLGNLKDLGVDIAKYQIDHLALRTESLDQYMEINKRLLPYTSSVGEILIRNRPINILKLNPPLTIESHQIPFLEVISPAENNKHKFGLEHIEVVVSREVLLKMQERYPNVNFDSKNMGRVVNPELILYFPDGTSVKFHPLSVDEAQKLQKETGQM